MDTQIDDEYLSDDEIFFGPMTLKEVKKHLMIDRYRHSLSCTETKTEDSECSLKIIEACSEPELVSGISLEDSCDDKTTNSWDITTDNDSFLETEKMISNLLLVDNKEKEELDNTLDVVEYILNNAPHTEEFQGVKCDTESSESKDCIKIKIQETKIKSECTNPTALFLSDLNNMGCCSNLEEITPVKERDVLSNCELSPNVNESAKKTINKIPQNNLQLTPRCDGKLMNVFKTPKCTVPFKNRLQTPRSTTKLKAYQHITSPVATYIKSPLQTPLLKEIRSKKPQSNVSLIPKPVKSSEIKTNKENIILPSLAYKSAKSVKVVEIPDKKRMPENEWAKSLSSSLQKPTVLIHNHKEINGAKKKAEPQPDDSFANLTLHQADVSICSQKTACNKLK